MNYSAGWIAFGSTAVWMIGIAIFINWRSRASVICGGLLVLAGAAGIAYVVLCS